MSRREGPIRVLVVDDSATMRRMLTDILDGAEDIDVVGAAADPMEARERIKALNPDVVTLDVEMPKMDGVSFLEKIMRLRPTPVVMVSTLTAAGTDVTLRALEIGAVECVAKPAAGHIATIADELVAKVRVAAGSRPRALGQRKDPDPATIAQPADDFVIAIGASTGGVEALHAVFSRLPANAPPVVVVQHMPPSFTSRLALRLDRASPISVSEADHDMLLRPGVGVVAPGGRHLELRRSGRAWRTQLRDGPAVNGHTPAVDVLFHSIAASSAPDRAVAAVLTGMGRDGAAGAVAMAAGGASVFVQDEASCVVYGMPKAAMDDCPAARERPIEKMAHALVGATDRKAA
ncbi:MAG: chemotaxis response regulator protein-glutamate methylesterase [Pseudomonadota bacterium]